MSGVPIDYLVLDYSAEITMSILQKQKARNLDYGYARDVVPLADRVLPELVDHNIKILSNADGVNPRGCARAIVAAAKDVGAHDAKVAVVSGGDIFERLDEILARGVRFDDPDGGAGIETIRDRILSANFYLGAFPLVEALQTGANIVIVGRHGADSGADDP